MKTNLIFKRQVTLNGVIKTVTRIVPVEVPQIESGEGWLLSGHTDCIETTDEVYIHRLAPPEVSTTKPTNTDVVDNATDKEVLKFNSNVSGTAKLVRSRGVIKIVARKGKSVYNQTTPNSVCIDDFTKNNFFKECRAFHGNIGCFQFTMKDGKHYDYWNNIIDKEYTRQKNEYLAQVSKNA